MKQTKLSNHVTLIRLVWTYLYPEHELFNDFRAAVKTATGALSNGNVF